MFKWPYTHEDNFWGFIRNNLYMNLDPQMLWYTGVFSFKPSRPGCPSKESGGSKERNREERRPKYCQKAPLWETKRFCSPEPGYRKWVVEIKTGELTFGIWQWLNRTTKRKIDFHVSLQMIKPRPYFSAAAKIQPNVSDLSHWKLRGKTDSHPGTCVKRTLQFL